MNGVKDWRNYADHAWSWSWLPCVFPSSQRVRPSDMDGWVEQGGQLLLLDGKVTADRPEPSLALRKAVQHAGNITALILRTTEDLWNPATHLPHEITDYLLLRGPWPAPAWQWGRWAPIDLDAARGLVASWAAWAYFTGTGNGHTP